MVSHLKLLLVHISSLKLANLERKKSTSLELFSETKDDV